LKDFANTVYYIALGSTRQTRVLLAITKNRKPALGIAIVVAVFKILSGTEDFTD
jgi:hypothetical protein